MAAPDRTRLRSRARGIVTALLLGAAYFALWQPARVWLAANVAYPALAGIDTPRAAGYAPRLRPGGAAIDVGGTAGRNVFTVPAGAYFLVPGLVLALAAPARLHWLRLWLVLVGLGALSFALVALGVGWAEWGFQGQAFLDTYVVRPVSLALPLLLLFGLGGRRPGVPSSSPDAPPA